MLSRWSKSISQLHRIAVTTRASHALPIRTFSQVAAEPVTELPFSDEPPKPFSDKPQVNLNKMFWSKPCSLALPPDSPLRFEDPQFLGVKRFIFRMLLFYSKQSRSIRVANVMYQRVLSRIDEPEVYDVFSLEKTFKTTFAVSVLYMWLVLRRLREDGKEAVELGQYLYEIYNHDLEVRVAKAGVNLLLITWMKDLEKIFYGNIVALDKALLPEAKQDELQNVIWRNVFSDDGSPKPTADALPLVQAMSRYFRREYSCMALTDREAILSGNFMFTKLDSKTAGGQ